jgi:hypothetical protein
MESSVEATQKLALALVLAGCVIVSGFYVVSSGLLSLSGSPSSTLPPAPRPAPGNNSEPTPTPAPSRPGPLRLALDLTTDRPNYTLGDSVHLTITLTNVGNDTWALEIPNPCSVVFLAYDARGNVVFNSTTYFGCIQVRWDLTLAPGESRVVAEYSWPLIRNNETQVPAPATYRLVPMFILGKLYQYAVVRTEVAEIAVDAR